MAHVANDIHIQPHDKVTLKTVRVDDPITGPFACIQIGHDIDSIRIFFQSADHARDIAIQILSEIEAYKLKNGEAA